MRTTLRGSVGVVEVRPGVARVSRARMRRPCAQTRLVSHPRAQVRILEVAVQRDRYGM